jgi:hypothetical protein
LKRFWVTISVVAIVIAGLALWLQRTNVAFVAAALGAVAWFLHYRSKIKELLPDADCSEEEETDEANET